jgi:hypothetical protein
VKFDSDWPRDARLDPFRDTVWELRRNGRTEGHLVCRVVPVQRLWAKREQLWYQVVWQDGRRERALLDSGPVWSILTDLGKGRFELLDVGQRVFDAVPVPAEERDALWARLRPSG